MWRAFFLALGGTIIVIGVESLVLDHAVLADDVKFGKKSATQPTYDDFGTEVASSAATPHIIHPPEWGPWTLISTGAVISLYAVAYKGGGG